MSETTFDVTLVEPIARLGRDVRKAAASMGRNDVRWLVDEYYSLQHNRIAAANQVKASGSEPNQLVSWVFMSFKRMEAALQSSLGVFAASYRVGQWLQAQVGIGPVISAGLLSHIDIRKAPTVGHIWRFAGLDPTLKWLGKAGGRDLVKETFPDAKGSFSDEQLAVLCQAAGLSEGKLAAKLRKPTGEVLPPTVKNVTAALARRPWNATLKTLCAYKAGESFVKTQNVNGSFYGPLFRSKKDTLTEANERGDNAELAAARVEAKDVGKGTDAWKQLIEGKLPQAQIHARARRWVVKLFLSHFHHVMFWDFHQKPPPAPFIFEHPEHGDHTHLVEPPLWPGEYDGRELKKMFE